MLATAQPSGEGDAQRWEALLARIANGDRDALSALYDSCSAQVFGLILRIVRDRAAAEEVALDVFLQVWRKAGDFSADRGSAVSWVLLLARSRALDYLRSKTARARDRECEMPIATPDLTDRSDNPETQAVAGDRRQVVVRAISKLDPPKRQAIEMAYFCGFSHSEIAERLETPIGTIKTRIRTGMQELRRLLSPVEEKL